MADQDRNPGNAKRNRDGTYIGNGWRTNQCVLTGNDCYVGDTCCESGDTCPSCNIAPCKCLPVDGTRNKKAGGSSETKAKRFANRGGNSNRNSNRDDDQCVAKDSNCYIGDVCCNTGKTCPSCNVAPCKC